MFLSCFLFIALTFQLLRRIYNNFWCLEEISISVIILLHAMSLGSSSFVEEEQYTWHFLTSTLFLIFLFSQVQSILKGPNGNLFETLSPVILVLIFGRVLRGWHQGGINWAHFPDISKLLLQSGPSTIRFLHIASILFLFALYSNSISIQKPRFMLVLWLNFLIGICLVLFHSIKDNISNTMPVNHGNTWIPQAVYIIGGISVISSSIVTPWVWSVSSKTRRGPFLGIRECICAIGSTYVAFWCLLQLLLQQPVNAVPILLIYMQLRACFSLFATGGSLRKDWVKVINV
jgi:ethanolamine phosphate transferase 2 subunit G